MDEIDRLNSLLVVLQDSYARRETKQIATSVAVPPPSCDSKGALTDKIFSLERACSTNSKDENPSKLGRRKKPETLAEWLAERRRRFFREVKSGK